MVAQGKIVLFGAFLAFVGSCKTSQSRKNDLSTIGVPTGDLTRPICAAEPSANLNEFIESVWVKEPTKNVTPGKINAEPGFKSKGYLPQVLATIPMGVLDWYFRLGGSLQFITNSDVICTEKNASVLMPFTNDEQKIAGCLRSMSPIQKTSNQVTTELPVMYLQVDITSPETVKQTLSNAVQGFALLISYYMTEVAALEKTSGAEQTLNFGATEYLLDKQKLAFYFVSDLLAAKKSGKISEIPEYFLKEAFNSDGVELFSESISANERWALFRDQRNIKKPEYARFLNNVLANVISADLCNDATRAQIKPDVGVLATVGAGYYREHREPLMAELMDSAAPAQVIVAETSADATEVSGLALVGGEDVSMVAPEPPAAGLALGQGRVLNFLGGVVAIPLALTEYTYQSVREFKPIKTSLRFIGEVVQGTVVGAVVLAQNTGYVVKKVGGKMIRGTVKAGAFAVQGTGALLNLTGRVVTAPFRWIGFR